MAELAAVERSRAPGQRLVALDLARAFALLAMASYHLIWDLEMFGYVVPGTAATGWPKLYARAIASSFLFLVGFSLVLAHGGGFRAEKFLRRLGVIVLAALTVSVATFLAFPEAFVFYGILHSIAVSSVLAVPFLRLPPAVTLAAAALVVATARFVSSATFDPVWLVWTGLGERIPRSFDFVPLFPWLAPVLLGVVAGRLAVDGNRLGTLARLHPREGSPMRRLDWIGRHSLAFYLLHQPLLISLVWLVAQVAPPDPAGAYVRACQSSCAVTNGEAMCRSFCACTADELAGAGLLVPLQQGRLDPATDPAVKAAAAQCTQEALGETGDGN